MRTVSITTKAIRELSQLAPEMDWPRVSSDTGSVAIDFSEEVYQRIERERMPNETVSDAILRLCEAYRIMQQIGVLNAN